MVYASTQATLFPGIGTIIRQDKNIQGYYPSDLIKNLQDRSSPPSGFTPSGAGGTFHNKTAHTTVGDRTSQLPIMGWVMATGTTLGIASSITIPYRAFATSAQKIVWPANSQVKITNELIVPSNYSTTVKTQALKLVGRTIGTTSATMDAEIRIVRNGVAISADLNPTAAAFTASGTAAKEISVAISYNTLAKDDLLNIRVFPSPSTTSAVELFGAFLQYTAEE